MCFSASASRSGFGAAVSVAAARSSTVFCNSVPAGRSGIAVLVLWLLAAASAHVILLSFAAKSCRSYCSGCMKVANGALAADFSHFRASCVADSLCESFPL